MKKAGILPALLLLASGCATQAPYAPVALVPLGGRAAEEIRGELAGGMPGSFTALQSAVFEYRRRALTAVCLIHVDMPSRSFSVVGMTPLGVKLFEIEVRDDVVETSFAAPGLEQHGNPVQAIAGDIMRVYFDRIPPASAVYRRGENRLVYMLPEEEGTLEMVVGGKPPVLVEKRWLDGKDVVWSVSYHEHMEKSGALHPRGIVLNHRRYGYRLLLGLKELFDDGADTEGN